MSAILLTQAQSQLSLYLDAEAKLLLRQSATIGDKRLDYADLAAVQKGIEIWSGRVERLSRSGGLATREVIPR